jgi:signal peptidase I
MTVLIIMAASFAAFASVLLYPQLASAHCDTMDGPTVKDGKLALERNNLNYALKWIASADTEELRKIFTQSIKVRALGPDARDLADRFFLESLVRIHRAGEGAPFEGLKPSGSPVDEKVTVADKCVETGDLEPLAAVRLRIAFVTRVRSCSMSPTLRPGQLLLAVRVHREEAVTRGDIVVVASAELGRMIIKRVIGAPGDVVVIDGHGRIRVNEVDLDEPYVAKPAGPAGTFTVPRQHVLLLGDNRAHSSDSRQWEQPFLPTAAIRGRVLLGGRRHGHRGRPAQHCSAAI